MTRRTLASVGCRKYTAGTPATASRRSFSSRCRVTPCLRSSATESSGPMTSRQKSSYTSTFQSSLHSAAPPPPPVLLRIAVSCSVTSASSRPFAAMASGNGWPPYAAQKESVARSRSYVLREVPPPDSERTATVTRLRRSPSVSSSSARYVDVCATITARSTLRSSRMSTGRWNVAAAAPPENSGLRPLTWSRSVVSSLRATISAGPPGGHRMMGACPMDTHTENSAAATVLIASSMEASVAARLLYVV
mmetsp:Transcript_3392/g.12308  ORF Transcript_3392/g.12308 Transcript_3392/m.12308 type:complete len:249 (-) Transcript_3392:151-897(-)